MDKKLRIGIIGCGGIAEKKHLPALSALPELCEIVAFCDTVKERAEKAAKQYGGEDAKVYEDYKELLKDKSIDVVNVLTPNRSHSQIVVDAFAAGKHVMSEKPMAASSEDAQKMLDAWKKSGKKFTIGYQNRFRPEVWSLHEACVNGELGDIYFAKAYALRRKGVPTWGVFLDKEKQGGGPLIDIGTHALDMTLWMMNNYEPVSVSGQTFYKMADQPDANLFGPWDPKKYNVEDSAFGFIKFKNGAVVMLEASWVLNIEKGREASTCLCGTKAGADVYLDGDICYHRTNHGLLTDEHNAEKGGVAYFDGKVVTPAIREADQWLKCIINDTEPVVKPEEAFTVTRILEAIYESAKTGKEVLL